jgi:hypothetical protein
LFLGNLSAAPPDPQTQLAAGLPPHGQRNSEPDVLNNTRFLRKSNPDRRPDRLINEGRRRYKRLAATARPGPQNHNLLGLFSPVELLELTLANRWPPSDADRLHITSRRPDTAVAREGN